jgi:hypothetical protein
MDVSDDTGLAQKKGKEKESVKATDQDRDKRMTGEEQTEEPEARGEGDGMGKTVTASQGDVAVADQFEFLDLVDDEDEENVLVGAVTTEVNPLDTFCNEAIFGYCRLDILKPPAALKFGTWNNRPLQEKQAKLFAMQIGNTSFRPFAQGNLLPLIIDKRHVDPECIRMNPSTEIAPFLKLSAEAMGDPDFELRLAGGRHRRRATEILREQSKTRVTKLRDGIADAKGKLKDLEGKKTRTEKMEEKIRGMEKVLEEEKRVEETISIWGVILYEAGKIYCSNTMTEAIY